jgi:hypothetical protein
MADLDFETRLERLFDDPPAFSDREVFAGAVVDRLDRGWRLRRWVIGAAGLAGGVFGVMQVLRSNLLVRAESLKGEPLAAVYKNSASAAKAGWEVVSAPLGIYSNEVLWAAAGLAAVAVALAAVRAVDEF